MCSAPVARPAGSNHGAAAAAHNGGRAEKPAGARGHGRAADSGSAPPRPIRGFARYFRNPVGNGRPAAVARPRRGLLNKHAFQTLMLTNFAHYTGRSASSSCKMELLSSAKDQSVDTISSLGSALHLWDDGARALARALREGEAALVPLSSLPAFREAISGSPSNTAQVKELLDQNRAAYPPTACRRPGCV